jgi:glycosyltransferase involved in cell wall biosynthesis
MIKPILAAYQSEKIIIAPRGMLSTSALAVKPLRKFLYLWFLRTFGFAKYLNFHATSEQEVKDIQRIFPNAKSINVAGNIPVRVEATLPQAIKASNAIQFVFTGRMHPIKNLHILLQALQNVKGQITLIIIATREDEAYLNKCQQLANELGKDIQVNWLLDLPHHQIKPYLQAAHFFVLLSEVESFGHAIFEALAVGCPVLISDQTPWKNLQEKKAGWDCLRHYEIIMNGCLPLFYDLHNLPKTIMTHWDRELLEESLHLFWDFKIHKQELDLNAKAISDAEYSNLRNTILENLNNNLTTESMFNYIISKL